MRDKQIEEMAKDLEDTCENRGCIYENAIPDCDKCRAEWLYELGYRKTSDVAREVIDHLCGLYDFFKNDGEMIREAHAILFAIAELKKKYDNEE